MGKSTVAVATEEYVQLVAYVERLPHGALIQYDEVAEHLGIPMDTGGRSKLRRAILKAGREYSAVPTVGYQLADVHSAMPILTHKLAAIDGRVRRAEKATIVIEKHFYADLPDNQKEAVRFLGATFGAIRVASADGKKLYGKPRPQLAAPARTIEVNI